MAPDLTNLKTYEGQVAGHPASISQDATGGLIIKPTNQLELDFYETTAPALMPGFVGHWTPKFYGTLRLQGQLEEVQIVGEMKIEPFEGQAPSVVLENVAHRFVKPNIIDVKLGTQFWDEESSEDKVERMKKASKETTSFETGVRLTGFQVWNASSGEYVKTDKSYGKSIKVSDLPAGTQKALPSSSDMDGSIGGLPSSLLKQVLPRITERVQEYYDTVKALEWQLVGSSILIVYEGDAAALEEALKSPDVDSESEEDNEDEDEDDEDEKEKRKLACAVKAIDFAHARVKPGQGPDVGYNLGLETVIKLLKGRMEELK